MSIRNLLNHVQKQELLINLYEELLQKNPTTTRDTHLLKAKVKVARAEILKNNFEIKKTLDALRKEEAY